MTFSDAVGAGRAARRALVLAAALFAVVCVIAGQSRAAASPAVYQSTLTDSFNHPEGVSMDGANLLVADANPNANTNNRVVELTPDGTQIAVWGSPGSAPGQLNSPRQAVINAGQLDVSDSFNNRVDAFPSGGGSPGRFTGTLSTPRGIAVDPTGQKIAVADTLAMRIVLYNGTGTSILNSFTGTTSSGPLDRPEGVAFDSAGNVWVADTYHNRIVEFDAAGNSRAVWDNSTLGTGTLDRPTSLTIDGFGNVWIANWGKGNALEIDPSGTVQQTITTATGPTDLLSGPVGIAVDSANGELYVADSGHKRIVKYSIPAYTPPPPPSPPGNLTRPSVDGSSAPTVGETFTGYPGTWSGSPTGYQFEWLRCPDTTISNCDLAQQSSSSTYVIQNADVGDRMLLRVYAFNAAGTGTAYEPTFTGIIRSDGARHTFVQAIQVTQGAQFSTLPSGSTSNDTEPEVPFHHQYAVYGGGGISGTTLIAGQVTVARVFVASDAAASPRVLLYGYGPSGSLVGSPLLPSNHGVPDLGTSLASDKQNEQNGGYTFTLPESWAQNTTKLVAVASPYYQASQCDECVATNAMTLDNLSFQQQPALNVQVDAIKDSVSLTSAQLVARQLQGLNALQGTAVNMFPTGSVTISTGGIVDITGSVVCGSSSCQVYDPWNKKWIDIEYEGGNNAALAALHQYDANSNYGTANNPSFNYQVAVAVGGDSLRYASTVMAPRWNGHSNWNLFDWPSEIVISDILNRPISGLTHEFGHALGLLHTDGDKSKGGCGGFSTTSGYFNGLPSDNPKGTLDGVGLDRRTLQSDGNYKLLGPSNYGDLMSYCAFDSAGSPDSGFDWASDPNQWTGPYSWNTAATDVHDSTVATGSPTGTARDGGLALASAAAGGGWITVSGMLGHDGKLHVLDMSSEDKPTGETASTPGGELALVASSAGGKPLHKVSFSPARVHADVNPAHEQTSQLFSVSIPARGVASLALAERGRVLEKARRSNAPFRLSVPAQTRHHRALLRSRSVTLRWRASKGRARLTVKLLYSPGGRARWQVVYRGLNRNRVTLPGSLLARAPSGRIRVVVSDGFGSIARVSPAFRVTG